MYRLSPILRRMGACQESLDWLAYEEHPTFHDVIKHCTRIDWLLWLAGRTLPQRTIKLLACDLAELALLPKESHAPARKLLEQVRQWSADETVLRGSALHMRDDEWNAAYNATAGSDTHAYEAVLAAWRAATGVFGSAAAQAAHAAYCVANSAYANSGSLDAHAVRHAAAQRSLTHVRDQVDWFAVECQLVEIGRAWGDLVEVPG